jgi:hypothetical protein
MVFNRSLRVEAIALSYASSPALSESPRATGSLYDCIPVPPTGSLPHSTP